MSDTYAENEIDYPIRHAQLDDADFPLIPVGPVSIRRLIIVGLHDVYLTETYHINFFSRQEIRRGNHFIGETTFPLWSY